MFGKQTMPFGLFFVTVTDERLTPQDGHSTGISRPSQNEVLVRGIEDRVDQGMAQDYDHKSSSTASRAGKAADLVTYTSVNRQGTAPGDCRHVDAEVAERSIYDNTPEHCYANVEKDETGRLLNRDTLAFRTSDYDTAASSAQTNGQDAGSYLIDPLSTLHVDRRGDVPVFIHRTNKVADVVCTDSFNHGLLTDRNQSNITTDTTEQVPYHTGRSTFYQRMDSGEGILSRAQILLSLPGVKIYFKIVTVRIYVLASDSQYKGSSACSLRLPAVLE